MTRRTAGFETVSENIRRPQDIDLGEIKTASLAVGSATALTTATPKTIISIALPPGDYEVDGVVDFLPAASTSITKLSEGASAATNTFGADDTFSSSHMAAVVPTAIAQRRSIPQQRFTLTTDGVIFLIAEAIFTVSTMTAFGTLRAKRI